MKSADSFTDRARELRDSFPLGRGWEDTTSFADTIHVHSFGIHLVGFAVRDEQGNTVTGSAGDPGSLPVDRAYFELIERTAIVGMERGGEERWPTSDLQGKKGPPVSKDVLMPSSTEPHRWRYARSNGVAVGKSWQMACERAHWELLERDRLLRSWYGHGAPSRIELPAQLLPTELRDLYMFEGFSFSQQGPTSVIGVFGFPRGEGLPLLYGFGARDSDRDALAAAVTECVQRLGFLWGEEIPNSQPALAPTPDFHQEFYLCPDNHALLRAWLAGEHCSDVPEFGQGSFIPVALERRAFLDITPKHLASRLFVAKAIPAGECPLMFGASPSAIGGKPVHPIV